MSKKSSLQAEMFSKIEQWQQSGLTQKAWCEQYPIRYHIFHYWYKRYRDAQSPATKPAFIPLHVQPFSPTPAASCMELVFADGKRLLFHQLVSADYLKALIR